MDGPWFDAVPTLNRARWAARDRHTVDRYLSLDAAPVFSLSSAGYLAEAVGRAGELGFTDVLTHWPRPSSWYAGDEAVLEAVAAQVLQRDIADSGNPPHM